MQESHPGAIIDGRFKSMGKGRDGTKAPTNLPCQGEPLKNITNFANGSRNINEEDGSNAYILVGEKQGGKGDQPSPDQ